MNYLSLGTRSLTSLPVFNSEKIEPIEASALNSIKKQLDYQREFPYAISAERGAHKTKQQTNLSDNNMNRVPPVANAGSKMQTAVMVCV